MYFKKIHVRHIYYVDFDLVHASEFNSKHLAIVLKKNNDGKTLIVVPTSSSSNGIDNGHSITTALDDVRFNEVISICVNELLKSVSDADKIDFYFNHYERSVCSAIINTAYTIKNMNEDIEDNKAKIKDMYLLNKNYSKYLTLNDFNKGIDAIIKNCIKEHNLKE